MEDFDFDTEEVDGSVRIGGAEETNRVFLRGDDHVHVAHESALHEAVDFFLFEVVVVGKGAVEFDGCTEGGEEVFEVGRDSDT